MRFYDTASRRIRKFIPIRANSVRIYSCGPSVYAPPHLGNFRTYVFEDVVKRALIFLGYKVHHIMNITDVEDKAVRAAKGSMSRMKKITNQNETVFRRTARELNIMPADRYPKATENIDYMVRLIKKLLSKRLAYSEPNGDVYLDVSRFRDYGKFSRSRFNRGLDRKVTKDDYFQREAGDFLLWKAWGKSDGDIFWSTPLGKGRPGWHIECSAMSARFLGVPFDIHEGGIDNIFSHHENEIAQTRGATGKKPANYWIHVRHLLVEGKKMAKCLGNCYNVEDIHRMGYGFDAIRAHLLSKHYRRQINFTFKGLHEAEKDLKRCRQCKAWLRVINSGTENKDVDRITNKTLDSFKMHISQDFDIPSAMDDFCVYVQKIRKLIKKKKFNRKNAEKAIAAMKLMDSVLGIRHSS